MVYGQGRMIVSTPSPVSKAEIYPALLTGSRKICRAPTNSNLQASRLLRLGGQETDAQRQEKKRARPLAFSFLRVGDGRDERPTLTPPSLSVFVLAILLLPYCNNASKVDRWACGARLGVDGGPRRRQP